MKLQFDSSQNYQLQAVNSVVRIFEGQPLAKGNFESSFAMEPTSIALHEKSICNHLVLNAAQLLKNIQTIQIENNIQKSKSLVSSVSVDGKTLFSALNFTIEMETGTGKTYTFLRSVYELHQVYGFKRFVIVVPSVAIREGTIKNLQITHEHFQNLYGNPPINYMTYERSNLIALRDFATSNTIQILVINVDSFTKDKNIINTIRETGVKPIEYIQSTFPIVIIDEPQNFETDVRRQAIAKLNPLCTLRFSATHRNLYNLLYSLNPVQAYDLGLVKQIEVDGITSDSAYNTPYIQFNSVQLGKKALSAKLTIYTQENGDAKLKNLTAGLGDNLFDLSNGNAMYKDGFILHCIHASEGYLEFSNGTQIREGETQGGLKEEVMKFQIERTIKWHFEKVKHLKGKEIKVLSLFFIDKVANYRAYDAANQPGKGKFALWLEEIFSNYQKEYPGLIPFEADRVHNGYFSSDKTGKGKHQTTIWTDTKGTTAKDEDTYSLIMKEKERLISMDEPLQFIFSHSALREGWDNPNVFQICTLNESKSDLKKRQEIGRGLRLPVDSKGQRVTDKRINVLTLIANESYESFSSALQHEIQKETSVDFTGRIKNARAKAIAIPRIKELTLENAPLLFELLEKTRPKTRNEVVFSSEAFIQRSVAVVRKMPLTKRPMLESKTARLEYSEAGISGKRMHSSIKNTEEVLCLIPDIYSYIQNKIDVTRNSIYEILIQSDRYEELEINPQMYLDNAVACIQQTLNHLLAEGMRYEKINGKKYKMTLFKSEEVKNHLSSLLNIPITNETALNCVSIHSDAESNFTSDCEADERIKCYFKMPGSITGAVQGANAIADWVVINHSI